MHRILVEDLGPRKSFVFDEASGKNCYGPGQQILWLDEADIRSGG
jgi:hypothetical protein